MELPREMRLAYLERRKADLDKLDEACQKSELHFLERMGHQLKGNALPFGFNELNTLGTQLEIVAREGKLDESVTLVKKIRHYVENFKLS
jgi:HPt (histidine-containing phosphotransfer) domain-containing protein